MTSHRWTSPEGDLRFAVIAPTPLVRARRGREALVLGLPRRRPTLVLGWLAAREAGSEELRGVAAMPAPLLSGHAGDIGRRRSHQTLGALMLAPHLGARSPTSDGGYLW